MENCPMWSMLNKKVYKKCPQVYELERYIAELKKDMADAGLLTKEQYNKHIQNKAT